MKNFLFYLLLSISIVNTQAQVVDQPQFKSIETPASGIEKSASKVSADLNFLYQKHLFVNKGDAKTLPVPLNAGLQKKIQITGNNVLLEITLKENNSAARADLEKIGFKTLASYGRLVSGTLPVGAISQLENLAVVKFARPAYKPFRNFQPAENLMKKGTLDNSVTPVISQGDTAQQSYLARKNYKVNGNGVKVGVISDSYDNLETANTGIAHGELPGPGNPFGYNSPVEVLEDLDPAYGGTDEGRGMAEIVHDVAPGAKIAFHTAAYAQADFAQGILDLADAGCKVIVDDIGYYGEPFFQDGIIAQAVNKVKEKGVTYFSAAGNYSNQSYENVFRGSTFSPFKKIAGTAHNFSAPGNAPAYFLPITIPQGGYPLFDLQWDDPFYSQGGTGAKSDLDIYLLDQFGQIVAYSNEDNSVSGDPFELFSYYNPFSNVNLFYIVVIKYSGPDPSHLKFIYDVDAGFLSTRPAIPGLRAGAIVGHPKAEGAIATAAAPYFRAPAYNFASLRVEYYSSLGGTPNYLDTAGNKTYVRLKKPEITAPDGGNTSFFGDDIFLDADNHPNFFGTSAAAPHAAGVAALMIEAQKTQTITPDQIKGILSNTAIDMNNIYTPGFDTGFDYNTGYGLIQADKAVAAVKFPSVFVKDLKLEAVCSDNPDLSRNWKINNPNLFSVKAHWLLTGIDTVVEGNIVLEPGEKAFSTKTVTYKNFPIPNVLILDWKDNLNIPRIEVANSIAVKCGQNVVAEKGSAQRSSEIANIISAKPNLVKVYPNPATNNFKVYLSLVKPMNADISLYSIDGKLLYQKNSQSNGILSIDASGYKSGMYLLKVRQGEFYQTFKIMKQ